MDTTAIRKLRDDCKRAASICQRNHVSRFPNDAIALLADAILEVAQDGNEDTPCKP